MKKILISLMAIALVIGLVGAGVVASFSDTETSTGNTFRAGTLDLKVGDENPNLSPDFTLGPLAPGASGSYTWVLTNVGNLPGFLDLSSVTVVNTEGLNPESETGDTSEPGELGANLLVELFLDVNGDGNYVSTDGDVNIFAGGAPAAINGMASALYDLDYVLAASGFVNLQLNWSLSSGTGNDVQGDIVTVGMTFELDQVAD